MRTGTEFQSNGKAAYFWSFCAAEFGSGVGRPAILLLYDGIKKEGMRNLNEED